MVRARSRFLRKPSFAKFRLKVPVGGGTFITIRSQASFDTQLLVRNWQEVNFTPLTRAGLLVRKIMRNSIRRDKSKKQAPAKPGRPPKSRATGAPFKRIFSIPSRIDTFVVIGHKGFKEIEDTNLTVMEVHEFGKSVRKKVAVHKVRRKARSRKQAAAARRHFLSGRIKSRPTGITTKTIKYPQREFALPALNKAKSKLPSLWKNSFSRRGS